MPSLIEQNPTPVEDPVLTGTVEESNQAAVKEWLAKISRAKLRWQDDFKQMRDNMEFVYGFQWDGQQTINDPRYRVNLTLQAVNRKVAQLYARNPQAIAEPRERMNYTIWDENVETLQQAVMVAMQAQQMGMPIPPETMALLADYEQGQMFETLVKKVCRTWNVSYKYLVESHCPDFKEQMKQLVRRVIIAKAGYVRVSYCNDQTLYNTPSTVDQRSGLTDRIERAKEILTRVEDGEIDETSAEAASLYSLAVSMNATMMGDDVVQIGERIEFDFLPPTSVIPDERCRSLKEFIAASWVAIEYANIRLSDVNALFGLSIPAGGELDVAKIDNQDEQGNALEERPKDCQDPMCTLYEVLDYRTKTRCFVLKGWKDWVLPPETLECPLPGFWPLRAITFNDTEVEFGTRASIFPPSDVDLIKDAQREWDRTRDALRDQRNANAPKYVARKGLLTENDKNNIVNAVPNSVIELEGLPADMEPAKAIQVLQTAAIDPAVYDTNPLVQDIMMAGGMQEANIGPAQPNVTATVGTIAEQSRMSVATSNIDDLDALLTWMAKMSFIIMLRLFSTDTIQQIAGIGAVWPNSPEARQDFLNSINVKIVAASSGRPNKGLDAANYQVLAPILQAAGANPQALIREGVKRLDDQLDPKEFFPLPGMIAQAQPTETQEPQQPQQDRPQRMLPPETENNTTGPAMAVAS